MRRHGSTYREDGKNVHYGKLKILKALIQRIKGEKVVRFWTGTDARTLCWTPPVGSWRWKNIRLPLHRVKVYMTNWLINEHWAGCKEVKDQLKGFGLVSILKSYPLYYPSPVDKTWPKIMLYIDNYAAKKNRPYKRWVYGDDIAEELIQTYKEAHYFVIPAGVLARKGFKDLSAYYATADMLILTKRAAGIPRMKREAEINNIPVYYDPEKVNIEDIITFIDTFT